MSFQEAARIFDGVANHSSNEPVASLAEGLRELAVTMGSDSRRIQDRLNAIETRLNELEKASKAKRE